MDHNLPTRGPSRPPTHAAWVTYRPAIAPRGIHIHADVDATRLGEVVASSPLHGAGRPTMADVDYALTCSASPGRARGPTTLVADCEPIRRDEP